MYIQRGSETAADIDCWRVFFYTTSILVAWQVLSANDRRLADRDVRISQLNFKEYYVVLMLKDINTKQCCFNVKSSESGPPLFTARPVSLQSSSS